MRKTKLTLSVDREIVARAKDVARSHDTSLSRLVESFLRRLNVADDPVSSRDTPIVSQLRGLGHPGRGIAEYRRHIEEKFGR